MALLTKSKYMIGLQCPIFLWISINNPGILPEPDESAKYIMSEGTKIGELAKQLFPKGIDIPAKGFMENISLTKDALLKKKPVFEASIMHNKCYSRADILVPKGDKWDLIEVKSSTRVKDEHIDDVSFQKYCYESAGLKIRQCYLLHLNNEYIRKGDLNIDYLFTKTNITNQVNEAISGIELRIKEMFKIIESKEKPSMKIHYNCNKPHVCNLMKDCWDFLPEENVFDLSKGGVKCFDLFNKNILCIKDIPEEFRLTDKQTIQRACSVNCKTHVNRSELKSFLDRLKYPLYHLDFETFGSGIPLFDNSKAYQQIPFQFSLHIEKENSEIEHHSFIASAKGDPRPAFARELKKVLSTEGSIVVYNQSFEKMVLKELGECLPEHKEWVDKALLRIIDLLEPFKNFHYYNPKQKGSASIKSVLPVLTDKSYEGMDIGEGNEASLSFIKLRAGVSNEEERKIREDLEQYCSLDTEAMVWIIERLKKLCL